MNWINNGIFATLLTLTVYSAQEQWVGAKYLKILLVTVFLIITVYIVFKLVNKVNFIIVSFMQSQILANHVSHLVIISSNGLESSHFYKLKNHWKEPCRVILYDYDGTISKETYSPKYKTHYRSILRNTSVSAVAQNTIHPTKVNGSGANETIYFAEWPVQVEEPLLSNEEISISRSTKQSLSSIIINDKNEFSFRPRIPTKLLEISIVSNFFSMTEIKAFRTDISGKKKGSLKVKRTPHKIDIVTNDAKPIYRYVLQFELKNV